VGGKKGRKALMAERVGNVEVVMGGKYDMIMGTSGEEVHKKAVVKLALQLWFRLDTAFKRGGRGGQGLDQIIVMNEEGRLKAAKLVGHVFNNVKWSDLDLQIFPDKKIQLKGAVSQGRIELTFRLALFCFGGGGVEGENRCHHMLQFLTVEGNTVTADGEAEEVEGKMKRGGFKGQSRDNIEGRKSDR
jgi:hypothetical protein